METHGVDVAKEYFDAQALAKWVHDAFSTGVVGSMILVILGFTRFRQQTSNKMAVTSMSTHREMNAIKFRSRIGRTEFEQHRSAEKATTFIEKDGAFNNIRFKFASNSSKDPPEGSAKNHQILGWNWGLGDGPLHW